MLYKAFTACCIMSILMATTLINDNNTYSPANQQRATDLTGRNQTQRLNEGWNYMPLEFVTPLSYHALRMVGIDGRQYFAVGDRVLVQLDGQVKYGYIVFVEENTIFIYGDADLQLTTGTLEKFAISRSGLISDFPLYFTNDNTFQYLGGTGVSITRDRMNWTMSGGMVFVTGELTLTDTTPPVYLAGELPVAVLGVDSEYINPGFLQNFSTTGGSISTRFQVGESNALVFPVATGASTAASYLYNFYYIAQTI